MDFHEHQDGSMTIQLSEADRAALFCENGEGVVSSNFLRKAKKLAAYDNKVQYVEIPAWITIPVRMKHTEKITREKLEQALLESDVYQVMGGHPEITLNLNSYELGDYDFVDRNGEIVRW
jgi:hypothetical protein